MNFFAEKSSFLDTCNCRRVELDWVSARHLLKNGGGGSKHHKPLKLGGSNLSLLVNLCLVVGQTSLFHV